MSTRPVVAAPPAWEFPAAEQHRLTNGVDVLVHHLPGQHVASVAVVLDLPLAAEPADREGVATICARCLDEGTADLPGAAFSTALEACGAALGVQVSLSGVRVDVDVPTSRLPDALPLLRDAVIRPLLDEADVTRHVGLRLAQIDQQQANSAVAAGVEYRRILHTEATRAQRPNGGDAATVAAVSPADVRAWHRLVTPHRTSIVVAGDLDAGVLGLIEEAFGDWAGEADNVAHSTPEYAARTAKLVHRPGAVQADIRLGGIGIDRTHPRWADLVVAVHAMGGAFGSRVNLVLREDKGWTYGARVGLTGMRQGGFWATSGSFRTEVVADAITEARRLLDVTDSPFTDAEVTDAVRWFTGTSPLQYATADTVAARTATNLLLGLDPQWTTRNLAAIAAVTAESATAAYRELIDLDNLYLVVVGDADHLTEPLRAAGWSV
ncbi:M16 family metallopeptidase [Enemella sp. A6]|uniref:M16 family metallopeptidase n=1 Tax=Enemella sp. A6 TaxID=3440152 RepID=UPI003EC06851